MDLKRAGKMTAMLFAIAVAIWAVVYIVNIQPAEPMYYTQTTANWGGGEQLIFGMPTKLTPTPMPALSDAEAGALVVMAWEHYQIHKGESFRVDVIDTDQDTNDELSLCFTTPNSVTAEIHFFANATATGAATFEIVESPTVDIATGSAISIVNRNRGTTITSTVGTIEVTPTINYMTSGSTITSTGVVIRQELGGSSTVPSRLALESQNLEEFELATSTIYCVILTANGDNLRTTLEAQWYEIPQ